MKTPKETASELVYCFFDQMYDLRDGYNASECFVSSKQCALIAVKRTIDVLRELDRYEHVPKHVFDEQEEIIKEIDKL